MVDERGSSYRSASAVARREAIRVGFADAIRVDVGGLTDEMRILYRWPRKGWLIGAELENTVGGTEVDDHNNLPANYDVYYAFDDSVVPHHLDMAAYSTDERARCHSWCVVAPE